jgi:hypothetical protein
LQELRRQQYQRRQEEVKARSRQWSAENRERKRATGKAWALANPDRVLNSRMKRFGITATQYKQLLADQGGVCAICGSADPKGRGRFAVDHDHAAEASGELVVRGLLCSPCNLGLGYFYDDPEKLRAAARYLSEAE